MSESTRPPYVGGNVPNIIVVDPSPAHLRGYSFNAGDERFFDRKEAISAAMRRVKDRGCRQQVRIIDLPKDAHESLTPRWLVQDI